MTKSQVHQDLTPLIGEFAWHSLVEDPRIEGESQRHYDLVTRIMAKHGLQPHDGPAHILEIACYAHVTGYDLEERLHAQVTLFELSRHALLTGKALGERLGKKSRPLLVSGDFHHLPFEDDAFNLVYICSALHHTWRYQDVLKEMIRVLAPGGLLFFENEPTSRAGCFYKFRCNRVHDFTPLEKKLDELGMLRTVAEPFLGSRPEMLFDMIENQTMSLDTILETVAAACDLREVLLFPEACMGPLEQQWLAQRGRGQTHLETMIKTQLEERLQAAAPLLDEKTRGMGFSLPQPAEVAAMAQWISAALTQLPVNTDLFEFRKQLSLLFGAPLQLVAQKKGGPDTRTTSAAMADKRQRFQKAWPQLDGVYNTFPPAIREILGQSSLVADIQQSPVPLLQDYFPSSSWTTAHGDFELIAMEKIKHQLLSLINKSNEAQLQLPVLPAGGKGLLICRLFTQVETDHFYKITLSVAGKPLLERDTFSSENLLLKVIVDQTDLTGAEQKLQLRLSPLQAGHEQHPFKLALSYAGFFKIDQLLG